MLWHNNLLEFHLRVVCRTVRGRRRRCCRGRGCGLILATFGWRNARWWVIFTVVNILSLEFRATKLYWQLREQTHFTNVHIRMRSRAGLHKLKHIACTPVGHWPSARCERYYPRRQMLSPSPHPCLSSNWNPKLCSCDHHGWTTQSTAKLTLFAQERRGGG